MGELDHVKWAVVTSAPRKIAGERLAVCGFKVPKVIISADDVRRGKPDPEGFLKECAQLHERPEACVVFEDAPFRCGQSHSWRKGYFERRDTPNSYETLPLEVVRPGHRRSISRNILKSAPVKF